MTCTVTMPVETSWDDLSHADYQFATPFLLELEEGEFIAEKVVRLLPGRRMVAFGTWRGVPVVAKIFYDRKHAGRHRATDASGVRAMANNKIPTPVMHYDGNGRDKRIQVLIFERLQKAKDLEIIWQERESNESVLPLLQAVMIELATQHVLGVQQKDMHLGNFLIENKIIYTLDGAQVEQHDELLSKEVSMENLALFLSQLGVGIEGLQENLFLYYAKARSWLLKPQDSVNLQLLIKKHHESRWKRFEKKIFRHSSDFVAVKRLTKRGMAKREFSGKEFHSFLQFPDVVFSHSDTVLLKNGRSATVIRATLDGHDLVIKRYNMKNIRHRLRRALRMTRAQKSWRLAQKLCLFYVNTAAPVAYLETNICGVRGTSY